MTLNRARIRRHILNEMAKVINDDALFVQREIPGDADEEMSTSSSCGCQKKPQTAKKPCGCGSRSKIDTMMFKRNLYDMIDDVICLYDKYDDSDDVSADIIEKVAGISAGISELRKTAI